MKKSELPLNLAILMIVAVLGVLIGNKTKK
jgi:hypothetical protein